mmetsp:Transcript_22435/g.44278  ORF Transcript_22435/g.44278 Transcript_22435/m.44278 type:complete len:317 (-) Transcript_22435:797-1747(-)
MHTVLVHAHELPHQPSPPQAAQTLDEGLRVGVHPNDQAVEEHQVHASTVHFLPRQQLHVLHAHVEAELPDRLGVLVCGHVRQQRQVLHQPARLPLGGVRWAEHAPLRRLQRAGARGFTRLLKVRRDPGHHPERGDVGKPRQRLGDACAFHFEPFQVPVSGGDGVDEALGDARLLAQVLVHVEGGGAVRLGQIHVRLLLQLAVQLLELVLEEKSKQLARQLKAFVATVVLVVEEGSVVLSRQHAANDVPHVNGFGAEVEAFHDHVREHNVGQHLARLVFGCFIAEIAVGALVSSDFEPNKFQCLALRAYALLDGLFE